ncbi:hypothetical protein [Tunturibacter empetritectus]|uniref:Uncharacterized protein n=1 Tax=Tunturiibacter lichenicola TaxID=2051959 RepID=A0A7W8JA92_9BACT|nr:hypothetical protein [Edaphobacter lichenicola]MBB5344247.1 hypothetical protein [Edaphobacter lichenicola]
MKKAVHLFATLLCLLTLLVSAATCVTIAQPKQSSCDHCPKQSPLDPSCCSAQQQQAPAVASTQTEPQLQLHAIPVSALGYEISSPLLAPVLRLTAPPPLPPRTPLRI